MAPVKFWEFSLPRRSRGAFGAQVGGAAFSDPLQLAHTEFHNLPLGSRVWRKWLLDKCGLNE